MKSSRERMRKDEIQLTISLIPLAIESNRLFPSEEKAHFNPNVILFIFITQLNKYFKKLCWICLAHRVKKYPVAERKSTNAAEHELVRGGSTWVQAGELAALFGVLAEVLAALRALTQRGHTHLRFAVMTRAAQTRVVPFGGEVVTLVYNIVFYVHACLSCWENITSRHSPK